MPRRNNTQKSSPRPINLRSCISKRAFRNEKDALDAAERQMLIASPIELEVYRCDHCRYWHLTSKK